MNKKLIKPKIGWMVFNYSIPVYATLRPTKKQCIEDWNKSHKSYKLPTTAFAVRKVFIQYYSDFV